MHQQDYGLADDGVGRRFAYVLSEPAWYSSSLVPVLGTEPGPGRADERRFYTVANLFAAAEAGPGGRSQTPP